MFRFGLLQQALTNIVEQGISVTDEAAAIERLGYAPKLIPGRSSNIKITHAEDLALAEFYLSYNQ